MTQSSDYSIADRLLDAALLHVPFDGWSQAAFQAAQRDTGIDPALARALFPRAGADLALAWHRRGDAAMAAALVARDLSALRMRERIALALHLRLEGADREIVRRGVTLFALPHLAPDGARALWATADAIWTALGDTSQDGNWYTKRAILAGVWSAVVLYWLADDSPNQAETRAFIDRRIEDVMSFERTKARVRANPMLSRVFGWPLDALASVRPPAGGGLPGGGRPGNWRPVGPRS